MKYCNTEWTIRDLMTLIDEKRINLRPPYQRNFIWSTKDQKLLIDSINKGYPLPNFFILKDGHRTYEMIDGQQRAMTIHKFIKNEFSDLEKRFYRDYPSHQNLLEYKLNIVILEGFNESKESKEEFFYLVNKRGVQLNPTEVNHAYYHASGFMSLIDRMISYQPFIELDIFSDKAKGRMNDRSLVEEIAAYLFKDITDKRDAIIELYEEDIPEKDLNNKYHIFCSVIDKIHSLNNIKPISQTRYKQRNDFYSLFGFIHYHLNDDILLEHLTDLYEILVLISDNAIISPSNDNYKHFQQYALNCVSQSNSKRARLSRINFLNKILANDSQEISKEQEELISYANVELDVAIKLTRFGRYLVPEIE